VAGRSQSYTATRLIQDGHDVVEGTLPYVQIVALLSALALTLAVVWNMVHRRREQEVLLLDQIREREARLNLALWGSGDEFWDWNIRDNSLYRLGANQLFGKGTLRDDELGRVAQQLGAPRRPVRACSSCCMNTSSAMPRSTIPNTGSAAPTATGSGCARAARWSSATRTAVRCAWPAPPATSPPVVRAERERRVALEVLRSMSEAVGVIDLEFRFISVNPRSRASPATARRKWSGSARACSIPASTVLISTAASATSSSARATGPARCGNGARTTTSSSAGSRCRRCADSLGLRSHFVAVVNDITDKKRAEQELRYLANYDTLTGLPNRAPAVGAPRPRDRPGAPAGNPGPRCCSSISTASKDINDSLGHAAGDRLLKAAATRIQATVGASDTVARLGGDEFTVVLEDVRKPAGGGADGAGNPQRVLDSAGRRANRHEVSITPSLGISLYPDHALVPTDLLKFSDTAMYQAKAEGRNTYQIYNETMDSESRRRATVLASLRKALDRGEFRLVYQPRMALADGSITGVEALAALEQRGPGRDRPDGVHPLAEESGLIVAIGEWVLGEACASSSAGARPD
jgi:diguanylate cyclase (GGDEF)-like protein